MRMKISGCRLDLALDNCCDLIGFRVFRHIRCFSRFALERCQPLGFRADITMRHSNLIGGLTVSAVSCFLDLLQKLRIQIRRRRNGRFIVAHKAGRTDIQRDRHSRCTNSRIAFGIVAEYRHFCRTHMKLRWQIQRCTVRAEDDMYDFVNNT